MISFPLYLVFTVSYFLHLTSRVPLLGSIRFDLALMAAISLFLVMEGRKGESKFIMSPTTKALLVLIGYIILSIPLVNWPGSVIRFGIENYLKVVPFYFFMILTIRTTARLKVFIWVFLLCQTFRVLEPFYLNLTEGYLGDVAYSISETGLGSLGRLRSAPHDVLNATQFAWIINIALIFLYYCVWEAGGIKRLFFLLVAPLGIWAMLLTGARSGLLSLFITIIGVVLFGRSRAKRIIVAAVVLVPVFFFTAERLSPELVTRYMSIYADVEGHGTAAGRMEGLKKILPTLGDSTIFGHGLGTSLETNYNLIGGRAQVTHNLYIEILQELGIIGFVLFFVYVYFIIASAIRARRMLAASLLESPWIRSLSTALVVWAIMHLFYSFSCFGLNSWEWYFFGGLSTVCARFAKPKDLSSGGTR